MKKIEKKHLAQIEGGKVDPCLIAGIGWGLAILSRNPFSILSSTLAAYGKGCL